MELEWKCTQKLWVPLLLEFHLLRLLSKSCTKSSLLPLIVIKKIKYYWKAKNIHSKPKTTCTHITHIYRNITSSRTNFTQLIITQTHSYLGINTNWKKFLSKLKSMVIICVIYIFKVNVIIIFVLNVFIMFSTIVKILLKSKCVFAKFYKKYQVAIFYKFLVFNCHSSCLWSMCEIL